MVTAISDSRGASVNVQMLLDTHGYSVSIYDRTTPEHEACIRPMISKYIESPHVPHRLVDTGERTNGKLNAHRGLPLRARDDLSLFSCFPAHGRDISA